MSRKEETDAFHDPWVIKVTASREENQKNTGLKSVTATCARHFATSIKPDMCIQGQSIAFRYSARDKGIIKKGLPVILMCENNLPEKWNDYIVDRQ